MAYELAISVPYECTDRRARYRAQKPGKQEGSGRGGVRRAVPSRSSERRVQERDGGARWRRIQELSERLSEGLSDEARGVWLELEEAIHAYWLDVAADHYDRGVDVGLARRALATRWPHAAEPRAQLRAMIIALSAIADELEES